MMVGDQSACPACVRAGEDAIAAPDMDIHERRLRDYWGKP